MTAPDTRRIDAALFAMRLMIGVVFVFHGSQKLFGAFGGPGLEGTGSFMASLGLPAPSFSALLAAATEFVGGLAFVSGIGQRLVAGPLAFTMLVASFTAHAGSFGASQGGMEYPLTLAVMVAGLGLLGPGRWVLAGNTAAPALEPASR